ncbi:MAG: tetratricopeptide repeat protein [Polyangiaceae bacterium]|nr:tetratricopeptide repeat protein [Polyangiaceae bacterium]
MTELPRDGHTLALRCIAAARDGRLDVARVELARVLVLAQDSAGLTLVAGQLALALSDFERGLLLMQRAAELSPSLRRRALDHALAAADAVGFGQDARELAERILSSEPRDTRALAWLLKLCGQARWYARAAEHGLSLLELLPEEPELGFSVARLLCRLDRRDEAMALARSALALDSSPAARLQAAHIALDAGAIATYRALLGDLATEGNRAARVELGRLALWSGDLAEARRVAEQHAAERDGKRLLAALAVVEARYDAAEALLAVLCHDDPSDTECQALRAEASLRTGRLEQFDRSATAALASSDRYLPSVWLLRLMQRATQNPLSFLPRGAFTEVLPALQELTPESTCVLDGCAPNEVLPVLALALERLSGNRSELATRRVNSDCARLSERAGLRHRCRQALELIRIAPPEVAERELDSIIEEQPEAALAFAHRGELMLWLGRLGEARADLERAIALEPETRWAYIGLCGVESLEGNPRAALAICALGIERMHGTTGPAVYAYRGEAHRRLGHTDLALDDLRRAVASHPHRVGARVNLALALMDAGDDEAALDAFAHLLYTAPALMSDAAGSLGLEVFDQVPSAANRGEVLRGALEMMRGNRSSSCVTYFTPAGRLRLVTSGAHHDPAAWRARLLDRAKSELLQLAGSRPSG